LSAAASIAVSEETAGVRLDAFLARSVNWAETAAPQSFTRSYAAALIENGAVAVKNSSGRNISISKSYKVKSGDIIDISIPDPEPVSAIPQTIPLDIRYEDDDVIVVNKPRGMVVHPSAGHKDGTLVNALLYHCGDSLSGIGGVMRPGIVHRIDRDTAGLIIAAKNDFAHRSLSDQLRARTLTREYDAIVKGSLKTDSGTLNFPLGRSPSNRLRQAVIPEGRKAVTHYLVTGRYSGYTRVLCRLETGRTHQIRAHFAHIGHPLLGDTLYGGRDKLLSGQCLAAVKLRFVHPRTGRETEISCGIPDWYERVLRSLMC